MAGLKHQFKEMRFVLSSLPVVDVCEIGVVFLAQKAAPALSVHDMIAIKVAIYKWALIS